MRWKQAVRGVLAGVLTPAALQGQAPDPAALRGALRMLATAQEAYWQEHSRYGSLGDLRYESEGGVRVRLLERSEQGWAAEAETSGESNAGSCVYYMGSVLEVPRTRAGRWGEGGMAICDGDPAPVMALGDSLRNALMRDLRNLQAQQELHHMARLRYAPSVFRLPEFPVSPEVRLTVLEAGLSGWSARAEAARGGGGSCVYMQGDGISPATTRGGRAGVLRQIVCD